MLRKIFSLAVVAVLAFSLTGCRQAPAGIPPLTLQHAQQLQATDPDGAVKEYQAIEAHFANSNPELAAQALIALAQYTSSPTGYASPALLHIIDTTHMTQAEKQALDTRTQNGLTTAQQALLTLKQHLSSTQIAQAPATLALQQQIDSELDRQYSTTITYRIIDALVALTGRMPAFSYWFALLMIAIFIKLVTFPTMLKTYKSQREMAKIQPILKDIQTRYKDNPQEQWKKTQEAYKEYGVNPFASCLPTLLQLPIFWFMFALIRVYQLHFQHGTFLWINSSLAKQFPGYIGANLGAYDLPILVLYALSMMLTMKLMPISDPQMAQQQRTTSYMMTIFIMYYFYIEQWASAFLVYYLFQNLLSAAQQYYYIYLPNRRNQLVSANGVITLTSSPAAALPSPGTAQGKDTARPNQPPRPRPKRKKR